LQTYKPLTGIRVLSFELAFSLPSATRTLHDLGAEVVRVSPPERQQDRYISVIDGVFHGKPSIAIDLTKSKGRETAFDLAMQADVVCNNFRPRVMEKYNLSAGQLREHKANLICLQLSGYGTPGPWSNFPAFGPSTEAAGGMNRLMVDDDETPFRIRSGIFADQLSGRYATLAIVAALQKRNESGVGATIDLSMTACISHLMGEAITKFGLAGQMPEFRGNRDPRFVPQGIYPTCGTDEWISISVTGTQQWQRLCNLINGQNRPENAKLDSAASPRQRWASHKAIDDAIATWTRPQDKDTLSELLQRQGIAATPVRTVADSVTDPQLLARGALQPVRHRKPKLGRKAHPHPPLPWRVVGRQRRRLTDYRHTGQDNARVLKRWLNLSMDEIGKLKEDGVLCGEPPFILTERPPDPLRDAQHVSTSRLKR
jgi:crotonobetainyl-CoA:carnitine CoA-transferase CaiB-like acyl-CoA transferase